MCVCVCVCVTNSPTRPVNLVRSSGADLTVLDLHLMPLYLQVSGYTNHAYTMIHDGNY